jgi:hypothetical protein
VKHRNAICPACGGPVHFRTASALVTVCEFCHSAVGRADRDVKDLGKVAEVGDPASGLARGLTGKWKRKSFVITGRVRYRHSGGGSWDEWYLSFPGERWGWLAEAQGKFWLTTKRRLASGTRLPAFEELDLNEEIKLKGVPLTVREKGVATGEGAEGELPWRFVPGVKHKYIDLVGPDGAVATFDYGDGSETAEQVAYLGSEVTLDELGIDFSSLDPNAGKVQVDALQLNCPQCGGTLALRAPDETLRIACPNCTSMLDAKDGKLSLFQSLHQEKIVPAIPLGSEGEFEGVTFTVIGFMERYAKYAGAVYPWTEYLLYHRQKGFRWLVCNEGHWSYMTSINDPVEPYGSWIDFDGKHFRVYDRGSAYVRYVLGEFYWQVQVGDRVTTADYIAPPWMLSFERTGGGDSEEQTVSLGTYITVGELERKFGLENLPRGWGVGVIQPPFSPGMNFWGAWFGFLAYVLFAYFVIGGSRADGWMFLYAMLGLSIVPGLVLLYKHNFEVRRWHDSDYSPYASDD